MSLTIEKLKKAANILSQSVKVEPSKIYFDPSKNIVYSDHFLMSKECFEAEFGSIELNDEIEKLDL